jgi:hypothetical protein
MSEAIGPMSVLPAPGQELAGLPAASDGLSEATRQLIEAEARRIVEECYVRAIEELSENRDRLDRLAAALLEHETLDEPDVYRLAGLERDGRPKPEPEVAAAGLVTWGRARSRRRSAVWKPERAMAGRESGAPAALAPGRGGGERPKSRERLASLVLPGVVGG